MPITSFYDDEKFLIRSGSKIWVKGFIDRSVLNRISDPDRLLEEMTAFSDMVAGYPRSVAKNNLRNRLGGDLANFLFISSIMDYGNIATSRTLHLVLLDLYDRYPFLFRPHHRFWDEILSGGRDSESWRILETILMPLSGLFRTDFLRVVVPNWSAVIKFLRNSCEGDASNFFIFATRRLGLRADDAEALRKIQEKFSDMESANRLKDLLGIEFSLGPKTCLLLLSLMTDNRRGFGVLRGASREQTARLSAPVDSAVIRVVLNTGLVKITYVNPLRKEGRFTRSTMTAACQRSVDLMAEHLGLMPIELDEYIWSVGTTACKHRGRFCYVCPLTSLCDSWIYGYVKESSGADYLERCFSFARPQTQRNALYLRGCENCPSSWRCTPVSERIRHPAFDGRYAVRKFSHDSEKIRDADIIRLVEGSR
jgi:hypothetical protein